MKKRKQQANDWLQAQQDLLLPVPYFLVTFTLPEELRALARSNQKTIYSILFRASAAALLKLAQDPRFVGGQIGMVGVLQTWTRQLLYHPHLHYLVTGGGLTETGSWRSARPDFLVPEKPLAVIFRAKLPDQLKKCGWFASVDHRVWKKKWVVDCQPVGSGAAAFKYLAPYVFRVALSNNRLRKLDQDGNLTFTYKESATHQIKPCTLSAQEFIRRFLQHVLPPRFIKVRYYPDLSGLSPAHRHLLLKARQLLSVTTSKLKSEVVKSTEPPPPLTCPHCRGPLSLIGPLAPKRSPPMKTELPVILVFLFVPSHWPTPLVSVALCLLPQKNQPSLAGSSLPPLNSFHPHFLYPSSPSSPTCFTPLSFPTFITQTPSSS